MRRKGQAARPRHTAPGIAPCTPKANIEALRHETEAAIEAVNVDLLKWLFGALIAQGGLIVALVNLLP